jgi:hypothetical protein
MDFQEVCVTGEHSIQKRMREKAKTTSEHRGYDAFYTAWFAFTDTFREINSSFYLNAINLMCMIEMMISQLLFKFGGTNDTW